MSEGVFVNEKSDLCSAMVNPVPHMLPYVGLRHNGTRLCISRSYRSRLIFAEPKSVI